MLRGEDISVASTRMQKYYELRNLCYKIDLVNNIGVPILLAFNTALPSAK